MRRARPQWVQGLAVLLLASCAASPSDPIEIDNAPLPAGLTLVGDDAFAFGVAQPILVLHQGRITAPTEFSYPIELRTVSVRTSERELLAPDAPFFQKANTATRQTPWVREVIEPAPFGLAQSWHFAARPANADDLVVEVAVDNATSVHVSEREFWFGHDERGVSYSHATWIDANDVATPIAGTWEGDRIRFVVPAKLVADSDFPAVLDPSISAETAQGANTSGSPIAENSSLPSAAWSGTEYLVVWRDNRAGATSDIWGARMTAAGAMVSNTNITVGSTAGIQSAPNVAYINGNYVAIWEDYKSPPGDADLRAARISGAGAVTAIGTVAVTATAETAPKLASRGATGLLVFQRGTNVMMSLYNGTTFGAASVVVAGSEAAVASNPAGDWLVTYVAPSAGVASVWGQFVTAAGALSGAPFVISARTRESRRPSAAFTGGNFVVAFASGGDLWGTRVTTGGMILDTTMQGAATVGGILMVAAANTQDAPNLVCGTTCLLSWTDLRSSATQSTDSYVRPFSAALVATGAESQLGSTGYAGPQVVGAAAAGATNFLAVWTDTHATDAQIAMASAVAAAPTNPSGVYVARSANRQSSPFGVSRPLLNGTNYNDWFLGWQDGTQIGDNILGQVNDLNGAPVGGIVTISGAANQQQTPAAAYDGTNWIMAWSDGRNGNFDIYASRVAVTTGAALDTAGIAITTAAGDQFVNRIASNQAGASLIVWHDRRNGNFDIYGAIVNGAGTVTAADIPISVVANDQIAPTVTWDATGGVFIVAWSDARAGTAGGRDIYAARVTTAGVVQDAAGVRVSNGTGTEVVPDAQTITGTTLIVWEDRRNATADIYGSRVRVSGGALVVDDPAGVVYANAAGNQSRPKLTYAHRTPAGRRRFVLTFADERTAANLTDVYMRIIEATGATVGGEIAIITGTTNDTKPFTIGGMFNGSGAAITLYQKYVNGSQTNRVYARYIVYTNAEI